MHIKPFWRHALWLAQLPIALLAGCRLYEKPSYSRLTFSPNVHPQKILFIGNSLTYYNDLPGLLQQLSAHESRPLQVDAVTLFNATLKDHLRLTAARRHLHQGGWDYVVLQEYSSLPATDPDATLDDYHNWARELATVGASPIIFENWAHVASTSDLAKMRQTYRQVQHDIGGTIAPVGTAWQRFLTEHPDINLFADNKHPTVAGTYLTACVLYRTIYHKPASSLPTAIPGLKLDPQVAKLLQAVADETPRTALP